MRAIVFLFLSAACVGVPPATAPTVENGFAGSPPSTRERNVDATFMAWYRFLDTEDGSVTISSVEAVALDRRHLLAISAEFAAKFYTTWRLEEIRISRLGADGPAQAPWEARVIASANGISVLETTRELPTEGVRLSLMEPREDDLVYLIPGVRKDGTPHVMRSIVFDARKHPDVHRMMDDDVSENVLAGYVPGTDVSIDWLGLDFNGGTFDQRHDMVAFGGQPTNWLELDTKAQRAFFDADPNTQDFYADLPGFAALKTVHLLPLLKQAGVTYALR